MRCKHLANSSKLRTGVIMDEAAFILYANQSHKHEHTSEPLMTYGYVEERDTVSIF